jgi:hypothetical protein
MSLKRLGGVLLAVCVLGTITASSALATNNWRSSNEKGQWYVAGAKVAVGGTEDLNVIAGESELKVQTTVGAVPLDLTLAGIGCNNCSLTQLPGPKATADGNFSFLTVVVSEPKNAKGEPLCSTTETLETTTLSAVLGMNNAGTVATFRFAPKEGTTFMTFKLTGAECPIVGTYKLTGVLFAQVGNGTNVEAVGQALELSKGIQLDAGEENSLKVGEKPAFVIGKIKYALVSEKSWKGNES